MQAFSITFVFLLAATFALADYESYLCIDSDISELADGCYSGCNSITCKSKDLEDKFDLRSIAVYINTKCGEPLSINITVKVNRYPGSWRVNMKPDHMVEVPGFPLDEDTGRRTFGGIYLKAQHEGTVKSLRLEITFLSSTKDSDGEVEEIFSYSRLAEIYMYKKSNCEFKRWWSSVSSFSKILVCFAGLIALVVLGIFCYYCCRFLPPRAAPTTRSNRENIPMQALVDEA